MKSTKLLIDYEYDFEVVGIISSAKDYKLAWHLNQTLDIKLIREADIKFEPNLNSKFNITNFVFATEYSNFRLLKNKAGEFENTQKPFILPEKKQYDFIIVLDGEFADYAEFYLEKMRLLPVIQLVDRFNVDYLISKENLLL